MSTLTIIAITTGVSLLGLLGGLILILNEWRIKRWSIYLMSFAAGSILGASFLELFPEALEHAGDNTGPVFVGTLIGVLTFFTLEKLLVWHHHSHQHGEETHEEQPHSNLTSVRPLVIFGDAIHNLLDGAIIALAFLTDPGLGVITSLAVVAHEIPQEIGDFSILIHSGMARSKVLLWNFLGALVSPLGALLVLLNAQLVERIEVPLLAFVIGNFIYIALADLVPTIQHERKIGRSILQLVLIILGVVVVWQLGALLPHK